MKIQLNHQVKEKKGGFYLSQIEDYHPGDRLSESSELFCLLEVEAQSHTFSRQITIHQNDIPVFYIKFPKGTWSR